mmetsp:Transcript_39912/g.120534  ORF Transcript_39912/g.120534 Transcript_39912/m.120534 type:complete len:329 (+) Transcript_39912:1836-2822(+)
MLLVRLVELEAHLQVLDQVPRVLIPEGLDLVAVEDTRFAIRDHLIRDLSEQERHPFGSVVIPRDGVDHLQRVEEGGQRVDDVGRRACVQRLDELLQCGQVLNIVLSLVERLCDRDVDLLPPAKGVEDRLPALRHERALALVPRDGVQCAEDRFALLSLQLLRDRSDLLYAPAPILELHAWPRLATIALLVEIFLEECLDVSAPNLEHAAVLLHSLGRVLGRLVAPAGVRGRLREVHLCQHDAAAQGADGLGQLCGERFETPQELRPLLLVAFPPRDATVTLRPCNDGEEDLGERVGEASQQVLFHLAEDQVVVRVDVVPDSPIRRSIP